jgi:hypothetical protein
MQGFLLTLDWCMVFLFVFWAWILFHVQVNYVWSHQKSIQFVSAKIRLGFEHYVL